ncbi:MAG: stringent starvation protein B [Gammaproteobacteria bacterium]
MNVAEDVSFRPHLLRAMCAWCAEKEYTPYIAAEADGPGVQIPPNAAGGGKTVILNISPQAVRDLSVGETVSFTARFRGAAFHVILPIESVTGIYARETGSGLSFPPAAPRAKPDNGPSLRVV